VGMMLEHLSLGIHRHLKPRSAGEFILPGLLKIQAVKKAATKARQGINPATQEPMTIPAKPAHKVVKVKLLKKLKDMVG